MTVMWKTAESFPELFRVWGSARGGAVWGPVPSLSCALCVLLDAAGDPCLRDDPVSLCTWRALPRPQGHSLQVGRAFLPKSGVGGRKGLLWREVRGLAFLTPHKI